ncbi:hypothetical protein AKJ37_01930 [candidate division MSBL1 archaeon SCGC-AAA259I09]|uniref:Bifunctional protein GlmU n=5 Tax=candidate division MSBL1 TaxID=215777 RepID=A0A133URJ5_9EURY|nr:hypothetical protein AKJ61_02675 [candidate division MSBL1 archaeon SCGC-AAA259B11]KXA96851.1 hypothetical protein AKJ38_02460 [candidate division MSBL1 archaeon SCGC-AAA259I14]KXA97911.1 hypothetical protein AKJ37_01930 [candidate division MSBL1 archaeon SCGC-AAA259I09]
MRVLVLAGGHATRLWPVTKNRAKPLLPLAGKKIIDYILEEIEQIPEVDRIFITTNEKFEDNFQKYLSKRDEDIYKLVIEKQESEEEKYGAIGGMINVIEKQDPSDYLIIGGDNYYSFSIEDFIDFSFEKSAITNACFRVKSIEEAKNYGIVDFNEDKKILDFQEKPDTPKSKMASTACYFFPEKMLKVFDEYTAYWEGKISKSKYLDEPGRFIEWIVKRYDTFAFPFEGRWVDIGTREGYLRAEKEISEGNTIRGIVNNSEIGENVTVLEGTKVRNSEIENSIVFENCVIDKAILKNSIIGDNTNVSEKDIREGLIKDL